MDDHQVHTHQDQGDSPPPDGIPAVDADAAVQALMKGPLKDG